MANLNSSKAPSSFARAALELDAEFSEIERLSGAIENLSVDTESGLDRAQRLLAEFSECGERVGKGIQNLGGALEEARSRAEAAIAAVSTKALLVKQRQNETDLMLERFRGLGEMVRAINATAAKLKKTDGQSLSDQDKSALAQHIPELDTQVGRILDELQRLRDDAKSSSMRSLERDAESMGQALKSVRSRLSQLGNPPTELPLA